MIKDQLKQIVISSVETYLEKNNADIHEFDFDIEIPKNEKYGDY